MRACPYGRSVILLIHIMMDEASNRLKDEGSDNDDANDGMPITGRKLNTKRVSFLSAIVLLWLLQTNL